ncbi:MAG TPA: hypothetical protein VMU28_10310 [Terriglobales bacterium]|nr:hypothetical protein [Terriglobales bacterium]
MNPHRMDVEGVVADLRRVEKWLTESLGVAVENPEREQVRDPFAPPDDLNQLKHAIDRIRPLLWVFLSRRDEAADANLRKKPASVRTLMDEAMSISDRHLGSND